MTQIESATAQPPKSPPSWRERFTRLKLTFDNKRDSAIMSAIELSPEKYKPQFLRILGSKEMRDPFLLESYQKQAEEMEPVFQKQIARGKLTEERAAVLRQAIINGDTRYFVQDAIIGMFVFGAAEKIILPVSGAGAYIAGYPGDQVTAAVIALGSANPTAIPYFLYRTIQEVKAHKAKLDEDNKSSWNKYARLSYTTAEGLFATQMNLWPFPFSVLATASVPILNRERYMELTSVWLGFKKDNVVDTASKIKTFMIYST